MANARARPVPSTYIKSPSTNESAIPLASKASVFALASRPPPVTGEKTSTRHPLANAMVVDAAPGGTVPALNTALEEPAPNSNATAVDGWPIRAVCSMMPGRLAMPIQPIRSALRAATVAGTTPPR
jgi:hypothetical protein